MLAPTLTVAILLLAYVCYGPGMQLLRRYRDPQAPRSMPNAYTVLVTGGAGFVGSHSVVSLLEAGYAVVVIDNLHNAFKAEGAKKPEALLRVEKITGKEATYYNVDILDENALSDVFQKHSVDCVIHFAALKAVGESCEIPLKYYQNNVGGSCTLFKVMQKFNVKKLVYSSSATVYGIPQFLPLTENHPIGQGCTNPYGKTKVMVEEIMQDLSKSDSSWSFISLRYFNPVGAHPSGDIGEDPKGWPNNLMPFISQVAVGRRPKLTIFGTDYNTVDGTGERDYIHIMDLAVGHLKAIQKLQKIDSLGFQAYNLGTGNGFTVLQVVKTFEQASGRKIKYEMAPRRAGDIDSSYADASLAKRELGWVAEKSLLDMCRDAWTWQSKNPEGLVGN